MSPPALILTIHDFLLKRKKYFDSLALFAHHIAVNPHNNPCEGTNIIIPTLCTGAAAQAEGGHTGSESAAPAFSSTLEVWGVGSWEASTIKSKP